MRKQCAKRICQYEKRNKETQRLKQFIKDFKLIYKTTLSYCLKCRKNIESKNSKFVTTKNGRMILFFQMCSG